jgi:hypothetical protein
LLRCDANRVGANSAFWLKHIACRSGSAQFR